MSTTATKNYYGWHERGRKYVLCVHCKGRERSYKTQPCDGGHECTDTAVCERRIQLARTFSRVSRVRELGPAFGDAVIWESGHGRFIGKRLA